MMPPATEAIAERAGVSVSSVFRYFESIDDLQCQTIERYFERFAPLFEIPAIGDGPLDDRLVRLVDARIALYGSIAPIARLARSRALEQPLIARSLADTRSLLTGQIRTHFAPELNGLTAARADDLASLIDALTAFEAWDHLRAANRRSDPQIRRAWMTGVRALVQPVAPVRPAARTRPGGGGGRLPARPPRSAVES